jgi:hypothetical protein
LIRDAIRIILVNPRAPSGGAELRLLAENGIGLALRDL